jgi:hypothetical protein
VRHENLKPQLESPTAEESDVEPLPAAEDVAAKPVIRKPPARVESGKQEAAKAKRKPAVRPAPKPRPVPPPQKPASRPKQPASRAALEEADRPVALCNDCGEPLDSRGRCAACGPTGTHRLVNRSTNKQPAPQKRRRRQRPEGQQRKTRPSARPVPAPRKTTPSGRPGQVPAPPNADEIIELGDKKSAAGKKRRRPADHELGEDEFWELTE